MESKGYCSIVEYLNNFLTSDSSRKNCKPFIVCGKTVGFIRPNILPFIQRHPEVFNVKSEPPEVHLLESLSTFEKRSTSVKKILQEWRKESPKEPSLVTLKGWRDETYDVRPSQNGASLLEMERSATCLFGTIQYGCHINGYTMGDDGQIYMWISKRSSTKQTYPNMHDQLAAGGLTSGLGYKECARKECKEEASIPDSLLENLKSVGCISYIFEDERGIFPEIEYVFDLLLPKDFQPVCADGEVQSFQLLPLSQVKELIKGPNFKPNSAAIVIDFLIRHGVLTPDEEPNFPYLIEMTHTPLHMLFGRND